MYINKHKLPGYITHAFRILVLQHKNVLHATKIINYAVSRLFCVKIHVITKNYVLWVNPTKTTMILRRYKKGHLYSCKIIGIEVFGKQGMQQRR